ncbi:Na+/H+ antiporter subunit D [Agilicoccus flavus]|uniref:Na+/H+ antiporter subunit D n=1 Tax=Agilicoccus flavus TaxID=2775968 RepID=UPI001CF65FC9|nr:Na+/H+ antiporter subunit D [Agilicoccus flavus]
MIDSFAWLVPLPVVLPLIGAGLTLIGSRDDRFQRVVSLTVLGLVLAASAAMLVLSHTRGTLAVAVGGWPPPMGIALVVDRLSALMLVTSTLVTAGVVLYAIGQGRSSDDETDAGSPLPIFHPTLMVLIAGVSTTFVSGDLFHVYVGFEMLLVASFVLLTLGGSVDRVRAGVNYVFVSLLSSLVFLLAIALVYAATGTVTLAHLAGRLDALPEGTRTTLHLLLLLGFAIKAAVFPMSGWLPDSYPTAPAPVTAVFAGLLTKVGVYAIIRTQTLLFPGDRLDTLLMIAAAATMVVGILGAIAQDDIKRMLSFTLVSHIGYMLFGVATHTQIGLSAALFYTIHHIVVQTTLFLVTGLVEWRGGSTSLSELGGLARTAPVIAVLFFVPAMNLAGIPPFSGFLGKVGLMQAGVEVGSPVAYTLVGVSALTSLLTLYAISRVWGRAFWRRPVSAPGALERVLGSGASAGGGVGDAPGIGAAPTPRVTGEDDQPTGAIDTGVDDLSLRTVPRGMIAPAALLVVVSVALTLVAGPLYEVTDAAAASLWERTPYVDTVLQLERAGVVAP